MRKRAMLIGLGYVLAACGETAGDPGTEPADHEPPSGEIEWTAEPPGAPEAPPAGEDQPEPADAPRVTAEDLSGSWIRALEGSTGTFFDWFTFTPTGEVDLVLEQRVYWDPDATQVVGGGEGVFQVTPEGTVVLEWRAAHELYEDHEVRRQTFTVLEPETWRAFDTSWWHHESPEVGRLWTFAGYLAQDDGLRRFRRESSWRYEAGDFADQHGFATELVLDEAPRRPEPEAPCALRVEIAVEALIEGEVQTGSEVFELDCRLDNDPETGLVRLSLVGLDGDAVDPWSQYLYDLGLQERYAYRLVDEFRAAFGAELYWDSAHPERLFHAPSGLSPQGWLEALEPPPAETGDPGL